MIVRWLLDMYDGRQFFMYASDETDLHIRCRRHFVGSLPWRYSRAGYYDRAHNIVVESGDPPVKPIKRRRAKP